MNFHTIIILSQYICKYVFLHHTLSPLLLGLQWHQCKPLCYWPTVLQNSDNLFFFFLLFSLETFYFLWIQWLSPFLSILPQNLPSSVFFIIIIIFSVLKLYLIPLYIIYFLDDTWSLTLVEGVFEMVYSYICTVVKVSVKWFQHLHCFVTRVCYCLWKSYRML